MIAIGLAPFEGPPLGWGAWSPVRSPSSEIVTAIRRKETMDENQVKGAGRRVIGRIESAAGTLAGSTRTRLNGKARAVAGEVQQNYGTALDAARGFTAEQPITALLAAAGIGFLVGLCAGRR
jgi:uncharacterized protein YjbJ (UPF0337 family)